MSNEIQNLLDQAKQVLDTKKIPDAETLQRQACELLRMQESDVPKLAAEIETLADIHCIQRKFDQSALEYAEVLQIREKLLPENDFAILRPLYRMAKSNFEGQRYEAAEAEMRRALSLAESRDDSALSVAFCLYELGWLLYFTGKYREAEPFFLKALPSVNNSMVTRTRRHFKFWEDLHCYTRTALTWSATRNLISAEPLKRVNLIRTSDGFIV